MSTYWNFATSMVSGDLAKAEDVNTNLSGIDAGLAAIETIIDTTLKLTSSPGVIAITLNAAARANKLLEFDANGDIAATTIMGDWQGNHANAAGTVYQIRDVVKDAAASLGLNNLYICITTHTSTGSLLTDTANWELLVDVTDVTTLGGLSASQFLRSDVDDTFTGSLDVTLAVAGDAIQASANHAAATAIRSYSNIATRTVPLVEIINDNPTGSGVALSIQQDQSGNAIDLNVNGATAKGIYINDGSAAAGGTLLHLNANNANKTSTVAYMVQDHASSTALLLRLQQDGNNDALQVDSNHADGTAIRAFSNTATRTQPLVEIINDNPTGAGRALLVTNGQSGAAIDSFANNAAGRAGTFSSNVASRTVPVLDVVNNNATGTGVALHIQQDQAGPHIELTGANGTGITIGAVVQPIIPAQVTDHVRAGNMQLDNGTLGYSGFDARAQVTAGTWETVGPDDYIARGTTAATNLWAAMSEMPDNATILIVGLVVGAVGDSATAIATVNAFFAEGNVTTPSSTNGTTQRGHISIDVNINTSIVSYETMVFIPLASDNQDFQVSWEEFNCTAGSVTVQLYYRGFMTD